MKILIFISLLTIILCKINCPNTNTSKKHKGPEFIDHPGTATKNKVINDTLKKTSKTDQKNWYREPLNLPPDPYLGLKTPWYRSLSPKKQRKYIWNVVAIDQPPSNPTGDTLIDLNYDSIPDYIVFYYGSCGTGIKNGSKVFLYNKVLKCYVLNDTLSRMPNPTYYPDKKKITSFYLANGGGYGTRLEWINGGWVTTKEFEVDNEGLKSIFKIRYPLKHKHQNLVRNYDMLPPPDILDTHVK